MFNIIEYYRRYFRYGLKDFYHNKDGQVDYPVFLDPKTNKPWGWTKELAEELKTVEISKRRTFMDDETMNLARLDNLTVERERHANRCTSYKEQEKWEAEFN